MLVNTLSRRLRLSPAGQVDEIALYNTTFRKLDGGVVTFANSLIASTGFSNLSRSGLHNESFKVRSRFRRQSLDAGGMP